MRKAVILFFVLFFALTSTATAARKISVSSDKNSLSLNEEMTVNASASGFVDGEKIYLKGAFYKDGSSNYFGFTNFNNSWIKNSATSKSQKEVIIGDWNSIVKVKLDYDDSGYVGIGDYKFKLGFYYLTSSGNISSVNWSINSLDISIKSEPSPTREPENISVNSANDNQIEISSPPSIEKNENSATAILGKSSSKSVKITDAKKEASQYAKIKPIEEVREKEDEVQVLGTKDKNFPHVFLLFGILLLAAAGFTFFKRELKERKII